MKKGSTYITGTYEDLQFLIKNIFQNELTEEEIKALILLELDSSAIISSSEKNLDYWLGKSKEEKIFIDSIKSNFDSEESPDDSFMGQQEMPPATAASDKTKYTLRISNASNAIIKNIFMFIGALLIRGDMSLTDGFKLAYDIISSIYKNLYLLEDYEWCPCFSAIAYIKENDESSFKAENVLDIMLGKMDQNKTCFYIDRYNCSWREEACICNINIEKVKDVFSNLCEKNVIEEVSQNSGLYKFVF